MCYDNLLFFLDLLRCVDRMNIGFFWTYHFECEPGTVFSDELDQCIHPYNAKPPCGFVPETTTPTEPTTIPCRGVAGTCRTYDVCTPKKETLLLCDKLECPLERSPELSCGEGYSFNMDTRACVKPPLGESVCLC